MLDSARDTASDIHLRTNGSTSLTNLTIVVNPACIDSSTASTYLCVKLLSKLEQEVEAFRTAYAITAGDDDRSAFEVVLCLLHVATSCFTTSPL